MRKTVSIAISGLLFHVEEQAYKKLEQYLGSIRSHFASYEDRDEIVSDIENRIAEHFSEKLTKSRKVINDSDVDDLIAHMGTVKDFEEFEGETPQTESTGPESFSAPKRLYRDPENQMIAGVASGIANYFGIDPTIVRLLFVISLIFGGASIVAYIILWVVMPEAKTTTERVEMRGQQLTLKRIEAAIRENVPAVKDRIKPGTLTRIVQFPFTVIRQILNFAGRILRFIVPLVARLIGVAIMLGTMTGLFFLTLAFIMLITNAWEAHMDIPVRQLAGNATYYSALVSGYLSVLLPGVLFILLGASLMLMRNMFKFPVVITIAGVWVASLMVAAVTGASNAPSFIQKVERFIDEHAHAVTRVIPVESFHSIKASGGYSVRVVPGTGTTVTVRGTELSVQNISVSSADDILTIERGRDSGRFCIICLDNDTVIDITVPEALANIEAYAGADIDIGGVDITGERITSNGGTRVVIRDASMPQTLNLQAMGGARIDIQSGNRVNALTMKIMGGSRIVYTGEAETISSELHAGSVAEISGSGSVLKADITSGSDLRALSFKAAEAEIRVSAGGRAEVHAERRLSGSADSGGSIRYTGEPETVEIDHDISGHVERIGDESFSEND